MEMEMEVDLRAEKPINAPPPPHPHLGCESQDQNQSLKKTIAMMTMLRKKGPSSSSSSSQVDGDDLGTPSPIPSPVPNDSDSSSTIENASSSGAITTPTSSDIEFTEEVRFKRMNSLTSSSSSASSKQEVVLHPCRRRPPPRSLLSSSPTSFSAIYLLDDEGRHRVSKLEKIVRVLKRTHSSLRREYWTSPPTSDELRLHHLILIHVTSYISLFDIELSALSFPPSQRQGDDDDPEELNDALDIEALPTAFSSFLQGSRKAACPRPEDDPLLKDTWALKSMMEDDTRNGEKKEELLRVLFDLEVIGRSRGYAPPLRDREIECYREIRNLTIFSILFVNSCAILQSDALTPGLDHFSCIPEAHNHFITHTPLRHYLSAAFEMIPFRQSFLDQCRHHISRILETKEEEDDDDVVADAVHENAEYNNDVDGDLVMEGGEAVGISKSTSAAAEAHHDIRGGGRRTPLLMMSRVECLQTIVSKFLRIGSLPCCPNPPTKEEARLYAQIAEHVYSSLWLFRCAEETQRTTSTGTGSLKTIDATDAWDYSNPDSDPSAARGIYIYICFFTCSSSSSLILCSLFTLL